MKKLRKLVSLVVSAALLLGAAVLPTGTEVYAAENVPPEIDTIDTQEETAYMEQADEPPRETGAEQADEPPRETGAEQADEPPRETGAEQADEPPRETGA
ncbi:MAG: hypothetical protein LBQ15_08685, partial [Clostridium sp.]|nr:hypothetical protein [Clostridium sp.]